MKLICQIPVKGLDFFSDNIQREVYLLTAHSYPTAAKAILQSSRIKIEPFINEDDCSGTYKYPMFNIFVEEE